MPSQRPDRLIVFFPFRSFLHIVPLGFCHLPGMVGHRHHHRCFGSGIDLQGSLGPFLLAGAMIQGGHAQIEGETLFRGKAAHVPDLAGQLGRGDGAKAGDAANDPGQV